jgi:hypothetical protein
MATVKQSLEALRKQALRYADTEEGVACKGTPIEKLTIKAGKKAFLFMGTSNVILKLRESLATAASLAAKQPGRYKVGANGWVTITFGPQDAPPDDLLAKWVDESYRTLAGPARTR